MNKAGIVLLGILLTLMIVGPFVILASKKNECAKKYDDAVEILRCESKYSQAILTMFLTFLAVRVVFALVFVNKAQ